MPHTFNPHPGHSAVDYLVRLHADLGGRIQQNKAEGERLAEQAKQVEAVIRMFDPVFNVRAMAARRRQARNPWFKRETLLRAAIIAPCTGRNGRVRDSRQAPPCRNHPLVEGEPGLAVNWPRKAFSLNEAEM